MKRNNVKRWNKHNGNIVFETNQNKLITYRADSLQGLALYVNPIIDSAWSDLKSELIDGLNQDQTVKMFMTYNIDDEGARDDLIIKAKYEYLRSRVCGLDVLIEVPRSLVDSRN